ncbi:MAG: methyl-accepting chemotaxis protein [bacterium]|jgi:methyl-accepting chemotaxis protein|nr:methyl-accepting chemotaxis protein [bacterium]
MENQKPYTRSTYLIKKGLQFRYMGVIIAAMLAVCMVVGFTIYFTIWSSFSKPDIELYRLQEIFEATNRQLIVRLVILCAFIAATSIFVSHKIAGPVYRFEQSARAIGAGDLSLKIKLRKGDELRELAEAMNYMAETLAEVVRKENDVRDRLIELINELEETLSDEKKKLDSSMRERIAGELTTINEELKSLGTYFKV